MTRINVTRCADCYTPGLGHDYDVHQVCGWFHRESAEYVSEPTYWDGNNRRGVVTGLQIGYEELYRTKGGRYVLHHDSTSEFNGPEFHQFLTDDQAREWLIKAEADDAIEQWFGKLEDERGPGRPEIGAPVQVRLGDLLSKVDAWATENGVKRAEAIRQLVATGLGEVS